jgi:hypothetical protein
VSTRLDDPDPETESGRLDGFGDRLADVGAGLLRRLRRPAWLARASAVGLGVGSLGFAAALLGVVAIRGELSLLTRPPALRAVLLVPPLLVPLAAGTVVGAVLAWRRGHWSLAARVHQTVLAVLGVAFLAGLAELGLLGWP